MEEQELKVGAVFDIQTGFEPHPLTGHLTKIAHGVNVYYTAILGSKTEFEPALWMPATIHDVPASPRQAAVADGAAWIRDVIDYLLPQAHQVVDWYHVSQHLADAAHLLYPDDDHVRQTWYTTMRYHLYQGDPAPICAALLNSPHPQKAH